MKQSKLRKNTLLAFIISLLIHHLSWGMQPTIFTWEDSSSQVHSTLRGTLPENNWYAEDFKMEDLLFHQSLCNNQTVMGCYGDGQVRTPESTLKRVEPWAERFEKGQPHGGMTVFQLENKAPIGFIVAGVGDGAGVSEVAYAYMPEVWGKGIGNNVVEKIVTEWAPEVRRIGLNNVNFQCFGGKVLERLDATASPSNPASWKILVKNNFHRAISGTSGERLVIEVDRDKCHNLGKIDYKAMETHVLEKYFSEEAEQHLEEGVRYLMKDPEGKERTLSKHKGFKRLKYHFEYDVK